MSSNRSRFSFAVSIFSGSSALVSRLAVAGWIGFVALAVGVVESPALAATPGAKAMKVPAPLKPWVDWVLAQEDSLDCPRDVGGSGRLCVWPQSIALEVDDDGGSFTLKVRVDSTSARVALPGDAKRWPLDVTVNRKDRVVERLGSSPVVMLGDGASEIRGKFLWDRLPESLDIPSNIALLKLRVRGKDRQRYERDGGRLWLEKQRTDEAVEDRLEVLVHRRIRDGVPLIVTTRVVLEVSGAGREVFLGPALLPDFIALRLQSPLPARVEDDGRIRIQVRPGTHVIELDAYRTSAPEALEAPGASGEDGNIVWPATEIWVFEAAPNVRVVRVEGQSVDPTQTRLPSAWQRLPAYALKKGDGLRLVEERRGDTDPGPDRLRLERTMWLDFDGAGMTVRDHIAGELRRSRRLEMNPPTVLGRVDAFGADQFITRLDGDASGRVGVELRAQTIDLHATSRMEGKVSTFPAVSWNHDFAEVNAVLNLPPGWRLLAATGVDDVSSSWMKRWTLLELFFLLIVTLGVFRLFGVAWAGVSFVTLTLLIPEPGAPQWIFAFCLIGEGLCRVVPKGPFLIAARSVRAFFLVILVAISIPFIVGQIRTGMYPALENQFAFAPSFSFDEGNVKTFAGGAADKASKKKPASPSRQQKMSKGRKRVALSSLVEQEISQTLDFDQGRRQVDDNSNYQARLRDFDPKASVQTGPGLPTWSWNRVRLTWSGPVQKAQALSLYLMSPRVGFAVSIFRVAFLLFFLLCLFRLPGNFWPKALKRKLGEHTSLFVLPLLLVPLFAATNANAQGAFPTEAMLTDLKARLLVAPSCSPNCTTAGEMRLVAKGDSLRILLDVDVAAAQAVPLPGSASQWLPTRVLVDNRPATALAQDGDKLVVGLSRGRHRLTLEGKLPSRETVQLRLPLRPHHTKATLSGWSLDGVHADGQADADLQLVRDRSAGRSVDETLEAAPLAPLVEVRRTITLNLNWEVQTVVRRLSPEGQAIVVEIPVLEGEHVTTDGMHIADGKVQLNMGARASHVSWTSSLQERPKIDLLASENVPWIETWAVTASPLWHVDFNGLPPVHNERESERLFSPWPGEKLSIVVARPHGVEGQTRTVDNAAFVFEPGLRATDATLTMTLRSSLGGPHRVKLPPKAELVEVRINNKTQPIRQKGREVSLPLTPGKQHIVLKWREESGIGTRFTSPDVDVGLPLVNASVKVQVPRSRWVLFTWGPVLGPAVLFWSLLFMVLLCAIALSRVRFSPLSLIQWALLGVGLTQVPLVISAFIAGWLLLLGWRKERPDLEAVWFDLRQIAVVMSTFVALILLVVAVQQGLLQSPDMQIRGNSSTSTSLKWVLDRTAGEPPGVFMLSVPLFVYRVLMLLWALWLAWSVVKWLREGWQAFRLGGFWRVPTPKPKRDGDGPKGPGTSGGPGGQSGPGGSGAPSGNPIPVSSAPSATPPPMPTPKRPARADAPPAKKPRPNLYREEGSGEIEMLNDAAGTLPPTATGALPPERRLELPEEDAEIDSIADDFLSPSPPGRGEDKS